MDHSGTYHFEGYDIPVTLMHMTGGGPDTFDAISRAHIANLQRHIGIEPHFSILEIGCGIGRDAIPLTHLLSASLGGRYLGIDIIAPSIAWCASTIQAQHPNFAFLHMDIKDQLHNPGGTLAAADCVLPLAAASVDRIVLQSVFTHMLRGDIEHYLAEFQRVLKPTALAYATTFIYDDAILERARATNLTPFDLRFEHEIEPGCRINDPVHPTGAVAYTAELLDEMLARHGLRHTRRPLKGGWSGFYPDPEDGQDVLIIAPAG